MDLSSSRTIVSGGSVQISGAMSSINPMIVISILDSTSRKFDVANTKAFTLDTSAISTNSKEFSVDKLTVYHRKQTDGYKVIGLGVYRPSNKIGSSSLGHLIYIINLDAPVSPCK
jgi:hypothetical protein